MVVGYAFGGGGGAGGYGSGISYALHKNGIEPDVLSTISVGALNGILVATRQYEAMKRIWHTITDDQVREERVAKYAIKNVLSLIGISKPFMGYWSSRPLQRLVRRTILGQTTRCDYYCGAVEVESNTFHHFHIPKGTTFTEENVDRYVKMIVASTAIPGIFQPIEIDGKLYVDGGLHHQMPLEPLSKEAGRGIDYIIGVSHKGRGFSGHKVNNDFDMARWSISTLLDRTSDNEFDRFEMINALVRAGVTRWRGKERHYYPSKIFRPLRSLSSATRFHHRFSRADFIHGRQMARRFTPDSIDVN